MGPAWLAGTINNACWNLLPTVVHSKGPGKKPKQKPSVAAPICHCSIVPYGLFNKRALPVLAWSSCSRTGHCLKENLFGPHWLLCAGNWYLYGVAVSRVIYDIVMIRQRKKSKLVLFGQSGLMRIIHTYPLCFGFRISVTSLSQSELCRGPDTNDL